MSNDDDKNSKSWNFQIDKTIVEDIKKNDVKKSEAIKRERFADAGKQLKIDQADLLRRKEIQKKDTDRNIHLGRKKKEDTIEAASSDKMIQALVIDVIFFVVLIFVSNIVAIKMLPTFESYYDESLLAKASVLVKQHVTDPEMAKTARAYLVKMYDDPNVFAKAVSSVATKIFACVFYLLFFFIPQVFIGNSLGKKISKIHVEHIDGGDLNFSKRLLRESFGKLISLLTVIGPFLFIFSKKRRAVHDYLSSSIVVENSDE